MLDVDDRTTQGAGAVEHAARFEQCGLDAGELHDAFTVGVLAVDHHQSRIVQRAGRVAEARQVAQRGQ
jgi:hypothetical protein